MYTPQITYTEKLTQTVVGSGVSIQVTELSNLATADIY